MKLLMIFVHESKKEELEVFLRRQGVSHYSEVPEILGMGSSGPRLGSGAYPGKSALIMTLVDPDSLTQIRDAFGTFCETCGEEIRMFAWEVEQIR